MGASHSKGQIGHVNAAFRRRLRFALPEEGAEAARQGRGHRHRRAATLPGGNAKTGQSGSSGNGPLAEQSGGKLAPAVPSTERQRSHAGGMARTEPGNVAFSADDPKATRSLLVTGIRLCPRLPAQPFQFRTPPCRPQDLPRTPLGRLGRVAEPCCLRHRAPRDRCVRQRRVRIRLTPPARRISGVTRFMRPI